MDQNPVVGTEAPIGVYRIFCGLPPAVVQRGPVDLGIAVGLSKIEGSKEEGGERGRSEGQSELIIQVTDKGPDKVKGAEVSTEADKGTQGNVTGEYVKGATGGILSDYSVKPLEIGLGTRY